MPPVRQAGMQAGRRNTPHSIPTTIITRKCCKTSALIAAVATHTPQSALTQMTNFIKWTLGTLIYHMDHCFIFALTEIFAIG
jgi:hypothetical protein